MIIIAPNLTLDDGVNGDINANNPVIGYANRVTTGNIAATTADASYPASNLANPATYPTLQWRGTSTATHYLTCTLTSNTDDVDYVGLAGHNFGVGSAGWTVSVEGDTGSGYAEIASGVLQSDDAPLMFRFAPAAYIGVRVKLVGGSAVPKCAVMYVGKLLVVQRRIYVGHGPITLNRQRTYATGGSESGNFTGRIVKGGQVAAMLAFKDLTPTWYRTYFDPFVRNSETKPFFFAWRPSSYPREVGYVWLAADAAPKNQRPNGMMQVDLNVRGIIA